MWTSRGLRRKPSSQFPLTSDGLVCCDPWAGVDLCTRAFQTPSVCVTPCRNILETRHGWWPPEPPPACLLVDSDTAGRAPTCRSACVQAGLAGLRRPSVTAPSCRCSPCGFVTCETLKCETESARREVAAVAWRPGVALVAWLGLCCPPYGHFLCQRSSRDPELPLLQVRERDGPLGAAGWQPRQSLWGSMARPQCPCRSHVWALMEAVCWLLHAVMTKTCGRRPRLTPSLCMYWWPWPPLPAAHGEMGQLYAFPSWYPHPSAQGRGRPISPSRLCTWASGGRRPPTCGHLCARGNVCSWVGEPAVVCKTCPGLCPPLPKGLRQRRGQERRQPAWRERFPSPVTVVHLGAVRLVTMALASLASVVPLGPGPGACAHLIAGNQTGWLLRAWARKCVDLKPGALLSPLVGRGEARLALYTEPGPRALCRCHLPEKSASLATPGGRLCGGDSSYEGCRWSKVCCVAGWEPPVGLSPVGAPCPQAGPKAPLLPLGHESGTSALCPSKFWDFGHLDTLHNGSLRSAAGGTHVGVP